MSASIGPASDTAARLSLADVDSSPDSSGYAGLSEKEAASEYAAVASARATPLSELTVPPDTHPKRPTPTTITNRAPNLLLMSSLADNGFSAVPSGLESYRRVPDLAIG
jgi:hypothetical protein